MTEKRINNTVLRLHKVDITDHPVEAFVFYARPDLKLGTGFGAAISVRGGPKIQEELDKLGGLPTGNAVRTTAGNMKAKHIIHAVGPRFQEENEAQKLKQTVLASLQVAEEQDIAQLAFPPMGAGFYGIPLDLCAGVMLEAFKEYLSRPTKLREIVICVNDTRELKPFESHLSTLV